MTDQEDYRVGYGKPPKHSQWKPGQSGNPKGRPKTIKDFEKLLDLELSQPLRITEGGQTRTITKWQGVIKALVHAALRGHHRAQKLVIAMSGNTVEDFEFDAGDREALNALFERLKKAGGDSDG